MICFPNAKINLGLQIIDKRNDGFHNLESLFYPVNWCDALEIIENKELKSNFNLHLSGLNISGNVNDNLIYKAFQLISEKIKIPPIDVYLHKNIPMGAGLGGGSSDAAYFINLLNSKFELKLTAINKLEIASKLGSDCAFFIENKPTIATQKGNVFQEILFDLSNLWIAIIYPNLHSQTKEAYSLITPQKPQKKIRDIVMQPIESWKHELVNDFEKSIMTKYPLVQEIKSTLYNLGAIYASMSGSGSAVYGLFNDEPTIEKLRKYSNWVGKMK
jgi:4-diphosphocytidyl-2-C-methyl-D-erythritol kinase